MGSHTRFMETSEQETVPLDTVSERINFFGERMTIRMETRKAYNCYARLWHHLNEG